MTVPSCLPVSIVSDFTHSLFVLSFPQSSRELLQSLSRKYLAGEGDIIKHLALIGYTVTHTQVSTVAGYVAPRLSEENGSSWSFYSLLEVAMKLKQLGPFCSF